MIKKNFDFIVIGSGPCGLLSASLLSEYGSCLVVEEGNKVGDEEKDIYTFEQFSKAYIGGGINFALGQPLVHLSEARTIGGGSTLNSSLHHRAPDHIWKMWREVFFLKGFSEDTVKNGYQIIEKLFNTQLGNTEPSSFYKKAIEFGEKVEKIPRWGIEEQNCYLSRSTAPKIFLKKIFSNNGELLKRTRYLNSKQDKNNNWLVNLYDLESRVKYSLKCKNLVLALGSGYTPLALKELGLNHNKLGKFEIHPTARISCFYPNEVVPKSIVEPYQITGHFPYLMIGSSPNRDFLSESNYPFRNNIHNIDFSRVQSFYSMAPSNNKGKIILNGFLRGLKLYNIDLKSKMIIKNGLKLILKIASQSGASHFFCSGGILDLNTIQSKKNIDVFLDQCIKKTLSSVHIMASASIGENKKFCSLNSRGQIDGLKGLLVIDQSTFPSCPTVNPQATAALISLINTRTFLEKL